MKESQDRRGESLDTGVATSGLYGRNRNKGKSLRLTIQSLIKKKAIKITLGSVLSLLILVGLSLLLYSWDHHVIVEGVKVSGVNVSNLTEPQAKEAIDKEALRLKDQTVKLSLAQRSTDVTLEELGLTLTADSALQEAYDFGRKGSLLERVLSKMTASKGVDLALTSKWNEDVLLKTINKEFNEFNKPAKDASFKITSKNTMMIESEQTGKTIDTQTLAKQIQEIDIFKPIPEIQVDYKEQLPQLTAAQLEVQKITGLLSTYTTRFDPSQTARSENVRLAAKALDGAVIKPGDILSFNQIVGERTVEGGYKDAYIIVDGEFVPGLAGGICQVSSTLYNTGLLANLAVVQRSNHDLAISYVPLGQDATVAYPSLDLKFQNNSGGYLLLRTRVGDNSLTIELYGKVTPGQEVVITNTRDSVIPPVEQKLVDETLPHGASHVKQVGQPGYIVNSTRTVKVNGQVIKTEPLKQSKYQPLPKIVLVGA